MFLRTQIEHFDEFHKNSRENAVDSETASRNHITHAEGSRPTTTTLSSGTDYATILGSKQKVLTVAQLLKDQSKDVAFTSFCSHVSNAVQALSSEPLGTIAVNDSHQVRSFLSLILCFAVRV